VLISPAEARALQLSIVEVVFLVPGVLAFLAIVITQRKVVVVAGPSKWGEAATAYRPRLVNLGMAISGG